MDVVIPIVFPDYKILVEVAPTDIDLVPGTRIDNFRIPGYSDRVSDLGHAGVLFVQGRTGLTKYYEYGRYDPPQNLGRVRPLPIPDAKSKNGSIEIASLKSALATIARSSGQNGRIMGVYIESSDKFSAMLAHAVARESENHNPKRVPYALLSNSCLHFMKQVVDRTGVPTPTIVDPRPIAYAQRLQAAFLDLDFANNVLTIESKGKF
jgi:hypothetical protein